MANDEYCYVVCSTWNLNQQEAGMSEARTEITTAHNGNQRVNLYCPSGHYVVGMGVNTKSGQRVLAGDYSRESCGHGRCKWEGAV